MKSITELNNVIGSMPVAQVHKNSNAQSIPAQAGIVVNSLFRELQAIYPAWKIAFPDDNTLNTAKRVWIKAFLENHIYTTEQIARGLKKSTISESPHIPSVGQFISWCKPTVEELGLSDTRTAYLEACHKSHETRSNWSHAAIYVAAKATGFYELKTLPESFTAPIFKYNYEIIIKRIMNGESFDQEIPKALPEQKASIPTAPDQALKNLVAIRKKLGLRIG